MAVTRYAGLKSALLLATAISATLSGCASVEYNKLADGKSKKVVPMPTQAAETAYAAPGQPGAVSTQTLSEGPTVVAAEQAAGIPLPTPNPSNPQMAALMQPAPVQAAAAVLPGQPQLQQVAMADTAGTNPLAQAQTTPGMELAYATPTVVAVPQPRPDIIAAANSIPTAGGPDDPQVTQPLTQPQSSAQKDAELLQQRLASADPAPGNPNPLLAGVAVPTPRPDMKPMGLEAYASTPEMMALDAFDTSAPKEIAKETGLAPSGKLQALIKKYAELYQVPEALVHRVVRRESMYNPNAYSRGNYGLMQIRYNTAKSLGYTGSPSGLFDAETNLKYAVKYLRGAFMVADNNHDNAVRLYARGYYYDAKRKGLLAQVQ
ncbi:lytic transglycosylase domain-containing protein [Gellertiella hungarica]|uniref:Soluble lytic murein transglycosylase-like protein n=1 Tax=Gellertiella hungarica TaxID=1572859 RepID=A0A7W6NJA2_9HYPH|nr:lytic transglycosylase domain-containing protein [Gellertiella hungarica]MBB4063533.1 soluble lytic murein transglycosylase-like protein [Gellertiella hungarica]